MGYLNFFNKKSSVAKLAIIIAKNPNNEYSVNTGSETITAKNSLKEPLNIGDSVLIDKSEHGKYYIIGWASGYNPISPKEVYIDG